MGPLQITLDGEPLTTLKSDKVRALLAHLALEADRPHRREKLAGLLWPEQPEQDARTNLRHALSNLRKAIDNQKAEPPFLLVSRQTIQFNTASDAWVDVTAFIQTLETPAPTVHDLEQAVDLYQGEFLEGFSIGDSAIFDEWVTLKREQLRRQASATLQRLIAYHEANEEYETALTYAWRQLDLEPWQEEGHRQVMHLLALNGQRGAALAQYEACRQLLVEELGVKPTPETAALHKRILAGEIVAAAEAAGPPPHNLPVQSTPFVGRALSESSRELFYEGKATTGLYPFAGQ